ncbi:MAG: hypothetical protein WDZ81_01020 [Candidatus Saccharimonadales bacterium]
MSKNEALQIGMTPTDYEIRQEDNPIVYEAGRIAVLGIGAIESSVKVQSSEDNKTKEENFSYELLQLGHNEERTRQLQRSYVLNTVRLVEKIEDFKPDFIVFLDKSARPVAWLLKELWEDFSDGKDLPKFRFLNIDREQWRDKVGGSEIGDGRIRMEKAKAEALELRSIFVPQPKEGVPIEEQESRFSGKRILVVDEVEVSGDTRKIAHGFLEQAFPDAEEIKDHTWMTAKAAKSVGLPDIPVWYIQDSTIGRGVDNRSYDQSQKSASAVQRRGWMFLSTRPPEKDTTALRYREEMKRLAKDWREGRLKIS